MSDFQKDLLKRLISINQFSTVRPSIKETCENLCSIICSRIKRKESGNILLIGSPGSGKSFIIKKAIGMLLKIIPIQIVWLRNGIWPSRRNKGDVHFRLDGYKEYIVCAWFWVWSKPTGSDHIRGADNPRRPRAMALWSSRGSTQSQQTGSRDFLEDWRARGARKADPVGKIKIQKIFIFDFFRSRFASAVHLIPPASDKELVEIAKDDLLSVLPEEKYRELWTESVEDGFMGLYDHLVDFAKYVFLICKVECLNLESQLRSLTSRLYLFQLSLLLTRNRYQRDSHSD